jgi:two-component system cell cycle response regulator
VALPADAVTDAMAVGDRRTGHRRDNPAMLPWAICALVSVGLAAGLIFFCIRYLDGRKRLDRLSVDLDRLSRVDNLTGLYNRRHLDEQLKALLSAGRRHQQPVSVLLIDVDHCKRVNDTAGHAGGDRALKETARRLRSVVRTEDLVGRWGGEEFLVLLPNSNTAAALVLAERLRAAVAAEPVDVGTHSMLVTISVGVSTGITTAEDVLLSAADDAMHESKRRGRNRVSMTAEPLAVAG